MPWISAGIVTENLISCHFSPPVYVPGHHVNNQPVSEPDGFENHLKVRLGLLLLHVEPLLGGESSPRLVLVLQGRQDPLQQVPVPTTDSASQTGKYSSAE